MARTTRPSKPAGKHPALRPRSSSTAAANPTKQVHATRKQQRQRPSTAYPTGTRRPITRSQSRIFRLADLPPELRTLIHAHIAASHSAAEPLDLSKLRIPPTLSPSRQFRAEALPTFFAAGHFRVRVVSNYCVYRRHWHWAEHLHYEDAGCVELSPVVTVDPASADAASVALQDPQIRFKHLTLLLDCICCAPSKQIARLELYLHGTRPEVECSMTIKPKGADVVTGPSLEAVFGQVRRVVDAMGGREGFNGFSVGDVEAVGRACVVERVDEEGGKGLGHWN